MGGAAFHAGATFGTPALALPGGLPLAAASGDPGASTVEVGGGIGAGPSVCVTTGLGGVAAKVGAGSGPRRTASTTTTHAAINVAAATVAPTL